MSRHGDCPAVYKRYVRRRRNLVIQLFVLDSPRRESSVERRTETAVRLRWVQVVPVCVTVLLPVETLESPDRLNPFQHLNVSVKPSNSLAA